MRNERGFTVIEVMIAVMVLAVGILAVAASSALVTRFILQGQLDTEATALAHQRIEKLRSVPCDSVVAGSETLGTFDLRWTPAATGINKALQLTVAVESPTLLRGRSAKTFVTTMYCSER